MKFHSDPFENCHGYKHVDIDFRPSKTERDISMDVVDILEMIKGACENNRCDAVLEARSAVEDILSGKRDRLLFGEIAERCEKSGSGDFYKKRKAINWRREAEELKRGCLDLSNRIEYKNITVFRNARIDEAVSRISDAVAELNKAVDKLYLAGGEEDVKMAI